MIYMSLNRLFVAIFNTVNVLQAYPTPHYGQVIWNPLHVLMLLVLYPLLFAYIFGMLRPGVTGKRYWLLSYVLPAVLIALYFTFNALYGALPLFTRYTDVLHYLNRPQLWILFLAITFSVGLMCLYTLRAIGMLRRHKRDLAANFSYTEGNTFGWMWLIVGFSLLKWFILLTVITVEGNTGQLLGAFVMLVEPVIITVLVLKQKDLYVMPPPKTGTDKSAFLKIQEDDDRSELSPKKRKTLKINFLALLHQDEIFKDPELNREKVCKMLGTNRFYLSQIINQDMNDTFYNLINTCRVNKSAAMMKDPLYRSMPLSSIAEICGFKSLGAFSTFFKQTYEKTPTEWLKEIVKEEVK
jgi:AraC-like DNA-binding protein